MNAPIPFATQEWLDRFRDTLNHSATFRSAAANWNDDALYVIDADPAAGWLRPVGFYMKWQNGEVVRADVIDDPEARQAVFRVTGAYSAWSHVHRDRMEAGIAFLTGKFKFRGPFAKAALNITGEVLMLKTAFEIPTEFRSVAGSTARPINLEG